MLDGYWEKSPSEKKYVDVDFAAEIPSGDTIKNPGVGIATAAVVTTSTGVDVTNTLVSTLAVSGTKLRITFASAGVDGMDYRVIARAQMNLAATIFDKMYELRVRASRRTF